MKPVKRLLAVILALCIVSALSACAGKPNKPDAEDAEKYVGAVLDLMCTGDYDHSVNLADADELKSTMEHAADVAMDDLVSQMNLSDDVVADFREVLLSMFSKARYTVGKAVQTDSGFDVPVVLDPMVFGGKVETAVSEGAAALLDDPNAALMTEEDLTDRLMRCAVDALKTELEDPQYGGSTEVVVHYKELQDGLWGIDQADAVRLGEAMIRTS